MVTTSAYSVKCSKTAKNKDINVILTVYICSSFCIKDCLHLKNLYEICRYMPVEHEINMHSINKTIFIEETFSDFQSATIYVDEYKISTVTYHRK
jgi:hypothetical protein